MSLGAPSGQRSTAAVLWLMIMLVFLPIAGLHGIARFLEPGSEPRREASLRVTP